MTETDDNMVSVRYVVDDVQSAIDFYTTHLGFTLLSAHLPAFADVTRGGSAVAAIRVGQLGRPCHTCRRVGPRSQPHPPGC